MMCALGGYYKDKQRAYYKTKQSVWFLKNHTNGCHKRKKGDQSKSESLFFFCHLLRMFTNLREITLGITVEDVCSFFFSHTYSIVLIY